MAKHTEPTFSISHYIRCKDIYAVVGEKNQTTCLTYALHIPVNTIDTNAFIVHQNNGLHWF